MLDAYELDSKIMKLIPVMNLYFNYYHNISAEISHSYIRSYSGVKVTRAN